MEGEFRLDDPLTWLLWTATAVMLYGCIGAIFAYVSHLRYGDRIMATRAAVQGVCSLIGLVALRLIHRHYLQG